MDSTKQHTLKSEAIIDGIGLHTGCRAKLIFKPAVINTGFVFVRTDLAKKPQIHAIGTNVTKVERGTTIEENGVAIHTVEHILAALTSQGLDNVIIEMNMPEPPIIDGSSMPFIIQLQKAGRIQQNAPRKFLKVNKIHHLEQNHAIITIIPSDRFRISCTVKYDQSQLDVQYLSLDITTKSFTEDLSEARTFCSYHELQYLMDNGLIKGGSLNNATIIHKDVIFSREGLRYEDEFVRHKMLDIIGDFSLLGQYPQFHIIAIKPGHPSNVTMVKKLLDLQTKGEL